MNDSASLRFLNSFLNLEKIQFSPDNRLWNLKRMRLLLKWADHPEKYFFPVIIAGTKGKGSTGFFLESILKQNRIACGFYHSPHLSDPRERIRLNAKMIPGSDWRWGLTKIRKILSAHSLPKGLGAITYFEVMTLLAALVFKKQKIQIGIFEVGMGGRLDASNTMNSKLALLTPIDWDHEAFLGNTIAKIAYEKACVLRRRGHAVVSHQKPEAKTVIDRMIRKLGVQAYIPLKVEDKELALKGDHQAINAGAALMAAEVLNQGYGFPIDGVLSRRALKTSAWPGRIEYIKGNPPYIVDVAHNPASARVLVSYLKSRYDSGQGVLIYGTSKDKNSKRILNILSGFFRKIVVVSAANPRAKDTSVLAVESRPYFDEIYMASNALDAMAIAEGKTSGSGFVVATGSFYVAGEVRDILLKRRKR